MYDLIAQGVTIALVIYFGLHLRQKLQTVQTTVAAQEKTIAAQEKAITGQAEQMKAQSTVLQDAERLNKIMQQVIDFVDPQAQLQREQAYRNRVDRELKAFEDEMAKMRQEQLDAKNQTSEALLLLDETLSHYKATLVNIVSDYETDANMTKEVLFQIRHIDKQLQQLTAGAKTDQTSPDQS